VQQQTEFVDQNMTLLALDQLAGIEAMRIDRGPPCMGLSMSRTNFHGTTLFVFRATNRGELAISGASIIAPTTL
jgi:hypothetical protein